MAIVLMLFTACVTVSTARQSTQIPTTTTTGAANAPASSPILTISRMEISAGVMDRTPLDIGTTYPASQEKVYCYLEFKDVKKETTASVVWMLGQNVMDKIPLTIKPYPKFRTWTSKTINGMRGEWKVDVLDDNGNLLKIRDFYCTVGRHYVLLLYYFNNLAGVCKDPEWKFTIYSRNL